MTTVLLPADFSPISINAITFAIATFKDRPCKFVLLNVHTAASYVTDDLMTMGSSASIYQTLIASSKASLAKLEVKLQKNSKTKLHEFSSIVDYDNFVDAVNQACKEQGANLVILGTKGASGLESAIFGSNTVHLMERSNYPVLAVPDKYAPALLNRWAIGLDFEIPVAKSEIESLLDLAAMTNALVDIICVKQNEDPLTAEQLKNKSAVAKIFENTNSEFITLFSQNVLEAISAYCDEHQCDAIALINKRRNFFFRLIRKDEIQKFGYQIKRPLLVMPKKTE